MAAAEGGITATNSLTNKEAKEMLEIKITIEAEGLSRSINRLADALTTLPVVVEDGNGAATVELAAQPKEQTVPPAVDQPVVQPVLQLVQAQPAAQPVVTSPVTDQPIVQPVVQQPVMNPPVVEQPVVQPVMQPVVQQPVMQAASAVTLDVLSRAGAALIDQGKIELVLDVLRKYGVQALNQLDPSVYPAFADDLRALGAAI